MKLGGWNFLSHLAYNGLGISDVADFQHHSRYEEPKLN